MEINLAGAKIQIGTNPQTGDKALIFLDPSGINVVVPLSQQEARKLGLELSGTNIVVANKPLPKEKT